MDNPLIHADARIEYIESYSWYHERGSHIAETFEREIEHALAALHETPDRWPVYIGTWRRIILRRFPFGIVYGVMNKQIVVIAIMHTRRKPGYWENRLFNVLPDKK